MELKINIDETMFKDVLEKELKAFSSEELHEIIRECIVEALKTDGTLRSLFIKPKRYSYESDEASQILFEAAKNINLSPAYEEIQEMMIAELKKNYDKLLQNVMLKTMVDGLCNDWNFRSNLELAVNNVLTQRANPNSY
jgi:hypothetical protein